LRNPSHTFHGGKRAGEFRSSKSFGWDKHQEFLAPVPAV
jgi:hypothetical protein